jgi:hypothetical protein
MRQSPRREPRWLDMITSEEAKIGSDSVDHSSRGDCERRAPELYSGTPALGPGRGYQSGLAWRVRSCGRELDAS